MKHRKLLFAQASSLFVVGIGLLFLAFAEAAPVPVPQKPYEDLRSFKNRTEYDTETFLQASVVGEAEILKSQDQSGRAIGQRWVTEKGFYSTYYTDEGVMVLSTIPDGRLKYGYFANESGESIDYREKPAPESCLGCHNKNRDR